MALVNTKNAVFMHVVKCFIDFGGWQYSQNAKLAIAKMLINKIREI